MQAELDSLSIANLEERYGVNRANLYKRITCLKEKGYPMEFESRDRKSYANADQILLMDGLHGHIKSGGSMNTFPAINEKPSLTVSRQVEMSHDTRDNRSAIARSATPMITLSSEQLIELVAAIAPPLQLPPRDQFENLEQLDRVCRHEWRLSSSQLAPLLKRQTLPAKTFEMFGYKFIPEGKNGREKAWKIEKIHPLLSNDNI